MPNFFLLVRILDEPFTPDSKVQVKDREGVDPLAAAEAAANRLRGLLYRKGKTAQVIVVEALASADMEKGASLPENSSGWLVFDAAKGYIVAQGLTEEQAVELLKLNRDKDWTRFKV